jgi:hypothetical protein
MVCPLRYFHPRAETQVSMSRYFAIGADRPLLQNTDEIHRLYKEHRWRIFVWLIVGTGIRRRYSL